MNKGNEKIAGFIEKNIGYFQQRCLELMQGMSLDDALKKRNPYLLKAKGIELAQDLVKTFLYDYITQRERTLFGSFLEELALFIGNELYNGHKSSAEGIDLEFKRSNVYYLLSIKSGPNWGNSSEVKKQKENFITAKRRIAASKSAMQTQAVLGCCFGRSSKKYDNGTYWKICGQHFWQFLSGDSDFYLHIIKPLGYKARECHEKYQREYTTLINLATEEFARRFCVMGKIDWEKIVRFNSGVIVRDSRPKPKRAKGTRN